MTQPTKPQRVPLKAHLAAFTVAIAFLALAAPAAAVNFAANGGSLGAIPDGTGTSATCPDATSRDVTFDVVDLEGTVTDVQVSFTLGPAHPFAGELAVLLVGPGGTSAPLFARTGATTLVPAGDDSSVLGPYTFSDSAPLSPTWWGAAATAPSATPIASASYRASTGGPNGGANTVITPAFSGVEFPNGTAAWTLRFFDCASGNTGGSVAAATLGVSVSPPSNNDFANAVTLNGSSVVVSGNNRGATPDAGEPDFMTEDVNSTDPGATRSVWYRWTAPGSGPATIDTCTTGPTDPINTLLAVFSGTAIGSLNQVATNDNGCTSGAGSRVNFNAVQGTPYRILVDGCCTVADRSGSFRLSLSGPGGPLLPFTPEGSAPTKGKPSNDLTLGKLKLNKDNGTATLKVAVPGEGKLSLGGKGLVKQRLAARGWALARQVFGAGKFKLTIKAKGAKKAKLTDEGEVKVKAKITFKPTGGTSATDTKKITLKKD